MANVANVANVANITTLHVIVPRMYWDEPARGLKEENIGAFLF